MHVIKSHRQTGSTHSSLDFLSNIDRAHSDLYKLRFFSLVRSIPRFLSEIFYSNCHFSVNWQINYVFINSWLSLPRNKRQEVRTRSACHSLLRRDVPACPPRYSINHLFTVRKRKNCILEFYALRTFYKLKITLESHCMVNKLSLVVVHTRLYQNQQWIRARTKKNQMLRMTKGNNR